MEIRDGNTRAIVEGYYNLFLAHDTALGLTLKPHPQPLFNLALARKIDLRPRARGRIHMLFKRQTRLEPHKSNLSIPRPASRENVPRLQGTRRQPRSFGDLTVVTSQQQLKPDH